MLVCFLFVFFLYNVRSVTMRWLNVCLFTVEDFEDCIVCSGVV